MVCGHDIAEIAQYIDEPGPPSIALDPDGVGAIMDTLCDVTIIGTDRIVGISGAETDRRHQDRRA